MSKKDISIIIPCYNCADTLAEAVSSCYSQELNNFEVVMVDDGSTDSTRIIMQNLSCKYPNIKFFFHERNKGGGATRNTAIEHSEADVIFCLDSDDILPDGTLSKMLLFLKEKKCDAVGIHKSIKFRGENINDIAAVHTFSYAGKKIPFESLLEKNGVMCSLYSTFMHTKKSFAVAGGYPTEHGFDTQGFAWRFLSKGLIAYTCPNATYLHRVQFKKSYYIRESNSGKVNYNWQDVLSEYSPLFNKEAKIFVLSFPCQDFSRNLFNELREKENIFIENYQALLTSNFKREKIVFSNRKYIKSTSLVGLLMRVKNKMRTIKRMDNKLNFLFDKISSSKFPQKMVGIFFNLIKKLGGFWNSCRARKWNPMLVASFLGLKLRKALKVDFDEIDVQAMSEVVDVVILTVSKDYTLVDEVIESVKENLKHKISNFYIVSQKNTEMLEFCAKQGYFFVDEVSVLGYGKDAIHYVVNGKDRSGWMFQQLLKLSGEVFVKQGKYFIVDSDTILIKPHLFIRRGKVLFLQSEEWHSPYFRAFKKLFGYSSRNKFSYTAHMMMFDTEMLGEMKKEIEMKHKKPWDKAYLDLIDEKENSCASDYDTYANWMTINHSDKVCFAPFYNTALSRNELLPLRDLMNKYNKNYKSLSFHHYNKNNNCLLRLRGGLGNQMFQYATGLAVASARYQELKLDAMGYDDSRYVNADTPRQYRMFPFSISASLATPEEVKKYKYPLGGFSKGVRFLNAKIFRKHYLDYDPDFFKGDNNYIEGYFQSEKNFIEIKDKVIKSFTLKNEFESEIFLTEKNKIDNVNGVSVHIRRGDYVSDPKTNLAHGVCTKEYYERAMDLMRSKIEKPIFYFFSDDIEWVKKEFGEHPDFRYVSNPALQDYEELVLMSACAHNIIANSSFSWWGAYLNRNPGKIVIAPKKWVNKEPDQHPNITPEGWTKI